MDQIFSGDSVYSNVKLLADRLTQDRIDVTHRDAKKLIFERLLTFKRSQKQHCEKAYPPLSEFSIFFRSRQLHEKADVLDNAIEKLYNDHNKFNVEALQEFLCAVANVSEDGSDPKYSTTSTLFEFSELPEMPSAEPSKRVFSYEPLDVLPSKPEFSKYDFPTLPYKDGMEIDEGFSESSSPIPALANAEQQSPKQEPKAEFELLSQRSAADFSRFWSERLTDVPYKLLPSRRMPEPVIEFDEFKRCFKFLLCGVPSWMFKRCKSEFQFEAKVAVFGMSTLTVHTIANQGILLGDCVAIVEMLIQLLEKMKFCVVPTLQALRLGLVEIMRNYWQKVEQLFSSTSGAVDLINNYKMLYHIFRPFADFCRMILTRLRSNQFTTKWLLDTLLEMNQIAKEYPELQPVFLIKCDYNDS